MEVLAPLAEVIASASLAWALRRREEVGSLSHDSNPGSEATVSKQEAPDSHTFQEPEVSTEYQGCGAPNTRPWKTSAQGLAFQPISVVFTFLLFREEALPLLPQPGQCLPSPSRFWGNISQSAELMGA